MKNEFHYIIRGGDAGAERLRVLSGATDQGRWLCSIAQDLGPGWRCSISAAEAEKRRIDIARRIGPNGRVVGIDMDDPELARAHPPKLAVYPSSGSRASLRISTTSLLSISRTLYSFYRIFAILLGILPSVLHDIEDVYCQRNQTTNSDE